MEIGQKLKDLRRFKNLTQEELGERTDLSKGYISQIESNKTSPSMETFLNILEVLGTTPKAFFDFDENQKLLYPKSEQHTYDASDVGYLLQWPVRTSNEHEMEPLILTILPKSNYKSFEPASSDTFVYCLEGTIALKYGETLYHATKGDAFYFKAHMTHQLLNVSDQPTKVMIVATSSYL
ncbi:helix-turn-helix domain-containing protein [Staphylococcus canis]|uniref:Helix-turn-helix domain-containing protein n=1 Tax=Staphylococcus canis TaxID=2724942 RepID=A0ABS0TAS1_9STAP|nr:XRE family transcriptional regulator [Staphylococcus canis]MBI5975813.1 helix-turn-helix domain-containing protein [Staphylococcus canis]